MGIRINVTVPDLIGDDLKKWADYEGRQVANLCNFLLERAVKEAKQNGEFPTEALAADQESDSASS